MPSTVIAAVSYDAPSRELAVSFTSGRCYCYHDVPREIFEAMESAFAKGEFFNRCIRGHFRYTLKA